MERSDQKAHTNTSAEMKISHNLKQDTYSEKNSSQTVDRKQNKWKKAMSKTKHI